MKNAHSPPRPKPAARHDTPSPRKIAPPAEDIVDEAADESGNRALHSVASGPNPNLGRDDVERVLPDAPGKGVETT